MSAQHLVGRAPHCQLQLEDAKASGHHAELRWTGSTWELRDLNSLNGTFVDNSRVDPDRPCTLAVGTLLAFGDPENLFELMDDGAPAAAATCSDGRRETSQSGTLLLPSAADPQCFIHQKDRGWSIERADGSVDEVSTGDTLTLDGAVWTLELPLVVTETLKVNMLTLTGVTLRFWVSANEETVELEIDNDFKKERLPSYVYWYTLLVLARARIADQSDPAISDAEQGWVLVDEVERQLKIDPGLLHQHVFRCKRALARVGVVDYAGLIERRPSAKQMRIGAPNLEEEKL